MGWQSIGALRVGYHTTSSGERTGGVVTPAPKGKWQPYIPLHDGDLVPLGDPAGSAYARKRVEDWLEENPGSVSAYHRKLDRADSLRQAMQPKAKVSGE